MEHTRPDSPSIFSLFFPRQEGWHPHELHQARLALVFSFRRRGGFHMERTRPDSPSIFVPRFFHGRSGIRMGRTRPDSPSCFFPFFSTSGGVGWRRQLRVEVASQA